MLNLEELEVVFQGGIEKNADLEVVASTYGQIAKPIQRDNIEIDLILKLSQLTSFWYVFFQVQCCLFESVRQSIHKYLQLPQGRRSVQVHPTKLPQVHLSSMVYLQAFYCLNDR